MEISFFDKVFLLAKQIPYGKVCTYGHIAKAIGAPRAARMVGWAINKSFSHPEYIPAHRVVNRIGMLSGKNHFPNQNTMQELLESEGIIVENDQIIDFEKHLWIPYLFIDTHS